MLTAYGRLLRTHPILTNVAQGCALGAAGDVAAQRLQRDGKASEPWTLDRWHCCTAAAFGGVMSGLVVPVFYARLDVVWPGTASGAVAAKSVADVLFQGGLGNALALAARGTPAAEVAVAMPEVFMSDCCVWMPYNLVAFRLIPLHVRPTTTAWLTLCWNTYLSWVAARGRERGGGGGGAPAVRAPDDRPPHR